MAKVVYLLNRHKVPEAVSLPDGVFMIGVEVLAGNKPPESGLETALLFHPCEQDAERIAQGLFEVVLRAPGTPPCSHRFRTHEQAEAVYVELLAQLSARRRRLVWTFRLWCWLARVTTRLLSWLVWGRLKLPV